MGMEIAGQDAELPEIRHRTRYVAGFMTLGFLALASRLFYVQVIEGDVFYKVTAESIVRTVVLPATRGQVRDRKGRVLATMVASYDVHVVPSQVTGEAYQRLRNALGPDAVGVPTWEEVQAAAAKPRERPLVVAEDIPREVMATLETSLDNPGIKVVAVPRRHYPMGLLAAHALGYMNEISADELRARKDEGYVIADPIGRTGVERQWEPYLRGQKGFEKLVVDRRGLRRADIKIADLVDGPIKQAPVQGSNVVLTLDADLQKITERAMRHG